MQLSPLILALAALFSPATPQSPDGNLRGSLGAVPLSASFSENQKEFDKLLSSLASGKDISLTDFAKLEDWVAHPAVKINKQQMQILFENDGVNARTFESALDKTPLVLRWDRSGTLLPNAICKLLIAAHRSKDEEEKSLQIEVPSVNSDDVIHKFVETNIDNSIQFYTKIQGLLERVLEKNHKDNAELMEWVQLCNVVLSYCNTNYASDAFRDAINAFEKDTRAVRAFPLSGILPERMAENCSKAFNELFSNQALKTEFTAQADSIQKILTQLKDVFLSGQRPAINVPLRLEKGTVEADGTLQCRVGPQGLVL